jgi:hypothetical protein
MHTVLVVLATTAAMIAALVLFSAVLTAVTWTSLALRDRLYLTNRTDNIFVLGSGFDRNTDQLDKWAELRIQTALKILAKLQRLMGKLICLGGAPNTAGTMICAEAYAMFAIRSGVPRENIEVPERMRRAIVKSTEDIRIGISCNSVYSRDQILLVCEKPFWFRAYREARLEAEWQNKRLRIVGYREALPAPLWYWAKEFFGWMLWWLDGLREGPLSRAFRHFWRTYVTERHGKNLGLYIANRDREA